MVKWCIACIYDLRTEVSRVVYMRNTPLNHDSYNIYADPLQRGRHFDPFMTSTSQFGQLRHVCAWAVGFGSSFDLEMAEKRSYSERCKINSEPSHSGSKKRLSLKRKDPKPSCERFALVSQQDVDAAQKPIIDDKCPEDILLTDDHESLCKWLCLFASEIRKVDGTPYTPWSITQTFAGLQRHISEMKSAAIQLVDPKNPVFKPLHQLLDRLYRDLHAQGIGATRRQSEFISRCDEDKLWETRVMGTDSPQALLSAVFFYNGLNFILRGGEEHRQLKISQLKFCTVSDPDDPSKEIECVKYTEHGSKNRPGGSHQLNLDNKVVVQYAMKKLQFHVMQGCTFKINVNL